VARLGSKEFVLVLPGTPSTGASHLATELLWKLARPYQLGQQELDLTTSIGVASYPDNGSDFDALLKSVTIAMHRAQSRGGDAVQFYSAEMSQQLQARDRIVKALRHAIERDQLALAYQPQVDLQTGKVCGLEALLRWQHPELGAVPPAQFIPLAEESGLINDLGQWVLERACSDIRHWLDQGIQVPHVAVNVSAVQLKDNDLPGQVQHALERSGIDPGQLYVELTESALMADVQHSETVLHELKALGVKLSLDDFGTGYSSLSYLKRFPIDQVKIDQSFVRDIGQNDNDLVLVKVIVSMAHGLGMKVIAEGVETEAQCDVMRSSLCDEIQGFFFSHPIAAPAVEALLREGRRLPAHLLHLHKPQGVLLLVDDEPNILAALKRLLRRDGYTILTADCGAQGLEVLARNRVDVIISDQRMPGMTGVEFLRAAKLKYPDTVRIVLSGYTELQSVTDAINEGAVYRFLTKPWVDEQLREHIKKAFEYQGLLEENRQLDLKIRSANRELVAANRQLGAVLTQTRAQVERDATSLAIVREALQHMPSAAIGVDDEGLMAFVNEAAQQLFAGSGPLLGEELAFALPAIAAAIAAANEGVASELAINGQRYQVKWNAMGAHSRSRGKIVTLSTTGAMP
jgi:EAL domain-containing protein (putative c-di-GMP-specific phosphodiesterase class I)/CheY-like chemotaxis protein